MTCAERFCALVGDWYTLRDSQSDGNSTDLHSFLESTGRLRQVEPEFIPIPE